MAKPTARISFVEGVLVLAVLAVLAKSAQVQIIEGDAYARAARKERTSHAVLPPMRGVIADRSGAPLADTRESYHVGVAPNEVDDPHQVASVVVRSLSPSKWTQASLERELRSDAPWVYFYGPYSATQIETLRALKGVYLEPIHERVYPASDLARGAIGTVAGDRGISGLEKWLDPQLKGVPGEAVYINDPRGRRIESPRRMIRQPIPGNDVVLTIDAGLQEIVERALDRALVQFKARSADAVFLDPRNGEILALASRLADGGISASAVTAPFEPGSTAKLFTAAALLRLHRVDSTDTVDPEGGHWEMPIHGRRLTTRLISDAHVEHTPLTLAQTVGVSSNIGMAKFSLRLSLEEQFDMLRDFGFGTPTGVEVSPEASGELALPSNIESPDYPRASRAMGYAITVTPVQLAAAYGAIANNGLLMAPTLIREIRAPDGTVLYRHRPEPVRQVITPEVAATLRSYLLRAVSAGGTGEAAQLQSYRLIGKTGTAHQNENGHYVDRYTASFAALFPADEPQLIAIVKVDGPGGAAYYGAQTVAPLVKEMLLEALASRTGVVNRNLLAVRPEAAEAKGAERGRPAARRIAPPPVVAVSWPYRAAEPKAPAGPIPELAGSTVRAAVTTLHRRGFKVLLHGIGVVSHTAPGAGEEADAGTTVTVWADK